MGTVYLIHFDRNLAHARHYIGFTTLTVEERCKRHHTTGGAKLLQALDRVGIRWSVVRTWENVSQSFERQLKNRKKARNLCPICKGEHRENLPD